MKTVANYHSVLLLALPLLAHGCEREGNDDDDRGGDSSEDVDGVRFFLPTPEPDNTSAPTVEVDAAGGLHAVYPAYAGGNAYYAYCPAGCANMEQMRVVPLLTEGTVGNAMIALDATGRPQVLLSTYQYVYYASCAGDCTDPAAWTTSIVLDHGSDREVTGEAFALDPQGRPRFVMHTYVAYLGIGQKAPETHFVTCDANCHDPESWTAYPISNQIWQASHLRYDAQGRIHLATVATVEEEGQASVDVAAYVSCAGDCTQDTNWIGQGLVSAFSTQLDAVTIRPAVSLAVTRAGAPRVLALGQNDAGTRNVIYFACDTKCTEAGTWTGTIVSESDEIGPGLDLALDAADHPRFVYTFNYNIGMGYCDADHCELADSPWNGTKVELGSDMPPDEIFLWPNCNVGAWFLHGPSIAVAADGTTRVGYQARDISGGWSNPDPTKPNCVAGTDMTWSRVALLDAVGG